MRLYLILLCSLFIIFVHATTLAQYAQAQIHDIDPDVSCLEEQHKAICNLENVEWIEGIVAKKIQYVIEIKDSMLLKHRYFELQPNNLNFEGYNLTTLIPTSILCIEKSTLKENKSQKSIPTNIECTLKSNIYHIVLHANFITTYPIYNEANTILEELMMEREKLEQPLKQSDGEWYKDYKITIKQATLWIKSTTLNQVLFDLYKREQRIATNPKPQNDMDYLATQDSVATRDYLNFLSNLHDTLTKFNTQADISQQNKQALSKALNKFIALATKPNQNLSLTIKSKGDLTLSLNELEGLLAIDADFFDVIIKILKHAQMQIA